MKNIIAYSLWGDHPMYWVGALKNIEQVKKYFPGWICRFYIDDKSDENLIKTIRGDNVEIVLVNSKDSMVCFGDFGHQKIQKLIFFYLEIVIRDFQIEKLLL